MVVRIRVRIKFKDFDKVIETSAKANAGYESIEPEIIIPYKILEILQIPENYIKEKGVDREYIVADGRVITFKVIPKGVDVWVITEDRIVGPVTSNLVISKGRREVLLSDKLLRDLKIALEDPGEGIWRFRDEPLNKLRKSVEPEYWY